MALLIKSLFLERESKYLWYISKVSLMARFKLLMIAVIVIPAGVALADEAHLYDGEQVPYAPTPFHDETHQKASDASFDKRLPPVIPGEAISDSGRKTRVWSSSGPVPVSEAPDPWKNNGGAGANSGGTTSLPPGTEVIIDRRDRDRE